MAYHRIEDPVKLRRLLDAVLLLEGDLSLPALLRHFVQEACSMTGARYGALGVLDGDRTGLAEFITHGLTDEEQRRIGSRPQGLGVLGLLIADPRPLRLPDIGEHPASAGFPPGHPPMTSFLGVPVTARDQVYGNLYLTDKVGAAEFSDDDESLVQAFAQAAGIAIENARMHERMHELAVLEDRDRIARDLHDAVIQRLFAIGLALQGTARRLVAAEVVDRLQQAVADIDDTIRQIRSSIFELASTGADRELRAGVLALVRELRPVVGFDASVAFRGPVETAVPAEVAESLLYTARELLTNVGRHARASRSSVAVSVGDGVCTLEVTDDGQGIAAAAASGSNGGGLGIANLRRRAEKLGGELVVAGAPGGGTSVTWRVPVEP
jgi:signal transduction histidine kinase